KDTGGVYAIDGRGWLARPDAEALKKWLKPGEWNDLSLVVLGDRVVVQVNGNKTAEVSDPTLRRPGRLALPVHPAPSVSVWFKDIQLLNLRPAAPSRSAPPLPPPPTERRP